MPVLHTTDLGYMGKCPRMYLYRKVEGLIISPSIPMIIGTATHRSAAVNLTHKRDEGDEIPLDSAQDAARDATKEEIDTKGVYLVGDETKEEKKLTAGAIDAAVNLATAHHASIAPRIAPKRIEESFMLDVPTHGIQLAGTIDVQQDDGRINDLKTSAKSPSPGVADSSVQLTMYDMAATKCFGAKPPELQLDYLVNLKGGPKVVMQTTTRDKGDWQNLLNRVEVCHNVIKAGIFSPTSPDNWWCSEKYCGYYEDVCPYGRRKRKVG